MTGYVCIRCLAPTPGSDCPICGHKTIAMRAAATSRLDDRDYRAICAIFTAGGVVNLAERMRRLSNITGRPIHDYWDLTEREGAQARDALRAWEKGRGNGGRLAAVRTPEGDEAA
jgi:predicted PhzF superfamily epimerase YddE/YHI9